MGKLQYIGIAGTAIGVLVFLIFNAPTGGGCASTRDTLVIYDTLSLPPVSVWVPMERTRDSSRLNTVVASLRHYQSALEGSERTIDSLTNEIVIRDEILQRAWSIREGVKRFTAEDPTGLKVSGWLHLGSNPYYDNIVVMVTLDTVTVPEKIVTITQTITLEKNNGTVLAIVGVTSAVLGFALASTLAK